MVMRKRDGYQGEKCGRIHKRSIVRKREGHFTGTMWGKEVVYADEKGQKGGAIFYFEVLRWLSEDILTEKEVISEIIRFFWLIGNPCLWQGANVLGPHPQ